jgi:phage terminase small subunit
VAFDVVLNKDFTEKQKAFVEALVITGNQTQAAIAAGYAPDHAGKMASTMLRQPAILAAVQIGVARDLAKGAAMASRVLQDFAADKTLDPRLRVVCARDILNRAGHIAPKAVAASSTAAKPLNEMSMVELRELADKLEDELSGRAKDVSSAKPAPAKAQSIEDIM